MRYDSYTMPDGRTTVRAVRNGSYTLNDMLEEMSANTTATRSDGLAVVNFMREYLLRQLSTGSVVTIDGIGTFGVSLSVSDGTDESNLVGKDVTLKRITFKAAPRLKQEVAEAMTHERVDKSQRNVQTSRKDIDERRAVVLSLLKEKAEFTSAEYRRRTGVCIASAHQDLQRYESEGLIKSRRVGRTKLYYPYALC